LARTPIANAIGAKRDAAIFTSGATESDTIAVFGVAERYATEASTSLRASRSIEWSSIHARN
jgi:cysteine sulfinate desulfinase/cysteine desulfurase-like protein